MDLKLNGQTALVTGASQGIGEFLAKSFAEEGVNLNLTARNRENLERIKDIIEVEYGVDVAIHPMDMSIDGACDRLGEVVGDVDILVNNAGTVPSGSLWDVDEVAWRKGWDLKVMGYINLCRVYYARMKDNGGGVIINNIGNGGEIPDPLYIAGTSGNACLMAFTRALGSFSLDDNIRVVGVNPGPVDTDRIYNMLKKRAQIKWGDADRYTELLENYPLKRPAHICEVSDMIIFLASSRSGYTSGTICTVDGGIASRRSIV